MKKSGQSESAHERFKRLASLRRLGTRRQLMELRIKHLGRLPEHASSQVKLISGELHVKAADTLLEATL